MEPVALAAATMSPVYIAAIAGLQVVVLALVVGLVSIWQARSAARIKREDKLEDWRRQDEVAARVAEAAEQAKQAAKLLAEEQERNNAKADRVAIEVTTAAKQAAKTASLLLDAQADTIARTDKVATLALESDQRVQKQLLAIDEQAKKIHTLVNSDMTLARINERDQTKLLLSALKQVESLHIKLAVNVPAEQRRTEDALALRDGRLAIEAAEKRVTELDLIIAERKEAQRKLDEEPKAEASAAATAAVVENTAVVAETLKRIEVNTEATAENTKRSDPPPKETP